MSRARHKHKKTGGEVFYTGDESPTAKEAMEKKRGGKVMKGEEKIEGKKAKARGDKRPRKAHGGKVGSDKMPFSSAYSPKQDTEVTKPRNKVNF